ncbi:MAG: ATP-binding protein [Candidatus Omnitrophica bacterium]|nr:ATP-binding protein [Candidatus Omnitrophota bacterium]
MPKKPQKFQLTINLSVLNDLGINLYSNLPAVISEIVANSWDADAENVNIQLEKSGLKMIITDDGCGMNYSDINDKYLHVGYKRREAGLDVTPKHKRNVMGRKGIGKLSLFSIANTIKVESVVRSKSKLIEKNGLILKGTDIEKSIKKNEPSYTPKVLNQNQITITKGTKITLSDMRKPIIGNGKISKKTIGSEI